MEEIILEAYKRSETGKSAVGKLRRNGFIPAVTYDGKSSQAIHLNALTVNKVLRDVHGERLISLKFDDGKSGEYLLKDVQLSPVGGRILHLDFYEIDTSVETQVAVEIRPIGEAVGLKFGGVIQSVKHEIQISCLPKLIPQYIDVDVSHLNVGDSIHVRDVKLAEGLSHVDDEGDTLIVLSAARVDEDRTEETEAVAEEEDEE